MKKSLLDRRSANEIVTRVSLLTPDNTHQWGTMNVNEMLLHCNLCNRQIMEEKRGNNKTTAGQFLLRILALYIAPHFKKNIQSEQRHITQGKTGHLHFEQLRKDFITIIQQFPVNNKSLTLTHPAFGNISTREWGIAAYKHMDHHLRQFNV